MARLLAASCAAAAVASLQAASFVLVGSNMQVGVDESGGLVAGSPLVGIQPVGWGPSGVDYITPGTDLQFYSIGVGGLWNTAGRVDGNSFAANTSNTSVGTTLSASTTGAYGDLAFTQVLSFGVNDTTIQYQITLENTGGSTLTNVVYAVGLDPDQDAYPYGAYNTLNSIPDADTVVATGPTSGLWIKIHSTDPIPHQPSVSSSWERNPYTLFNTPPNAGDGDRTISMAFSIGDMTSGQQVSFGYEVQIGLVPEPRDFALVGGLGLLGFAAWRRYRR